ncbi:MAG: DNA repair protein RadA [bacterium]
MAKPKTVYCCTACGHVHPKWFGRCSQCGEWNTLVEEVPRPAGAREEVLRAAPGASHAESLATIHVAENQRYATGLAEVDRVLGGGILPGAAILLGGEPGIGKSTLLLQAADQIAARYGRVLYISGEESPAQIKLRAQRLGARSPELFVKADNQLERMIAEIRALQPFLAIVDSIQTAAWSELTSAPGSVGQVRDCTALLVRLAKETATPIVLVGHVTKDGNIAGPRMLEHLVDVVLYFEGDPHRHYRILRGIKNRFGSTYEIGLFEMSERGLREVSNPAAAFAGSGGPRPPGSVVTVMLEGHRPLLIEVQALVAPFHGYGFPRRTVTGIDANRLAMILAVLEKRLNIPLGSRDVFVNVTGGITLSEPAGDLGVAAAILSSYFDISLPSQYILFGEIGLSGEVRAVHGAEPRVREAWQLGYHSGMIPEGNARELTRQGILFEGFGQARAVEEMKTALFEP